MMPERNIGFKIDSELYKEIKMKVNLQKKLP